ncbi:MAG: divalent metal cation transporter [Pirellulales bacterium]|nr:divalent metal cation transporter [Pirellulales bacterium]
MENQPETARRGPVRALLALLGPGLFLIGYNIGTGSVTTMAKAGSSWGMQLTWTVLLSCIFAFLGIVLFGRYTLATGDTILYAIRRRLPYGTPISLFIMATLILAEFAGVAGLTAIIVDLLCEWSRAIAGASLDSIKAANTDTDFLRRAFTVGSLRLTYVVGICAVVGIILWKGRYAFLETLLAVLVAVMGVCFLVTAVLLVPSWREILAGLVPGIPDDPEAMKIVAGMSGTTFSTAVLYCRSITLKAKGWGPEQGSRAWLDAGVSAVSMFFLSIAVMICAAGTLFIAHTPVEKTVDMVLLLEPLAGNLALSLFVIGIVGAGLSSLFPTILIAPWLISDFRGRPIDPKSWINRTFVVLGILFGLAGPLLGFDPVWLMTATMALLAVVTPFSMIAITVLLNQKHVGVYRNPWWMNVGCVAALVFSVVMQVFAVIAFAKEVQEFFQS